MTIMADCTPSPGNSPRAAIVGDNYWLHTAWHAVNVYRYHGGQFTLLRHPIHDHIIAHLLHGLALLAAVFRAISSVCGPGIVTDYRRLSPIKLIKMNINTNDI